MSESKSLLSSLIYRAIGEPEKWQQSSIEPLIKILTDKYDLDDPENLVQIRMGKKLVGQLSERDSLDSAVINVIDGARHGFLITDQNLKVIYYSEKISKYLDELLDDERNGFINKLLCKAIRKKTLADGLIEDGELIRLDYSKLNNANIYFRRIRQGDFDSTTKDYLLQIMIADGNDDDNQIFQEVSKTYGLSIREIGIVQAAVKALAKGGSTQEIADELFISLNTVKTHLKSIYVKSGVNSLASLVSLYHQHEVEQLAAYFGGGRPKDSEIVHSSDKTMTLSCGQPICYREYGKSDGRALVVLHNMYSSRLNIPPNGDQIAQKLGRRIIIPDRPGFGKSPYSKNYPAIWGQQLAELSEALELNEFDILSNALSVRYVLEFAQAYPEKLTKMILVAPLLHTSKDNKVHFSKWFSVATQLYERNPEVATEIYKLWHASASLRLHDHVEENLITSISSAEKSIMNNSHTVRVIKDNFRESAAQQGVGSAADFNYCFNKSTMDLSKIMTPAEIWIGSEDGLSSPQGMKISLKELPNQTINEIEGYGEHIYYSLFEKIVA